MNCRPKDVSRLVTATDDAAVDKDLVDAIYEDMRRHGGDLAPAERWERPRDIAGTEAADAVPSFREMLPLWVGPKAMEPVSPEVLHQYKAFLDRQGARAYLDGLFPRGLIPDDPQPMVTDLGTVMDVSLVRAHWDAQKQRHLVLEIGGGYGRLAQGFLALHGERVRYVLVDAVPESLAHAEAYLTRRFPNLCIGAYYRGDTFDLERFNCYVISSWRFEEENKCKYDVCANISSMQEMTQQHVDYYIDLFDRITVSGAIIYLSNSRDYIYQREFNYPASWELVLISDTPRSWSPHYPVELYRNVARDCGQENAARQAEYLSLVCKRYRADISELRARLEKTVRANRMLRERIEAQKARLQELNAALKGKVMQTLAELVRSPLCRRLLSLRRTLRRYTDSR